MNITDYISGIQNNNRLILSKAITLIESSLNKDQELAAKLIDRCVNYQTKSIRIGISGTPGVGKSTFIETLGLYLIKKKI